MTTFSWCMCHDSRTTFLKLVLEPHSWLHSMTIFSSRFWRHTCDIVLHCVAVCCSVLQCVVVCCNVLQCVAVCWSVLCVAVWCSVLQCVAWCCSLTYWLRFVEIITHTYVRIHVWNRLNLQSQSQSPISIAWEALQQRLHSFHGYESRQTGLPLHQIGPCTCAHHRLGSQTAINAVSPVLVWLWHCLRWTWSARAEGQASQGWAAARGRLAQHDVLVRVLQSPSALDCLIGTLSVFDGVVICIKNSSWRTANAPTLIESCQSVVYLTTSDAYASRRWLLSCSASQWSACELTINLQQWCLSAHFAWCVSLCAYT